jgi:hypothetical protein
MIGLTEHRLQAPPQAAEAPALPTRTRQLTSAALPRGAVATTATALTKSGLAADYRGFPYLPRCGGAHGPGSIITV